jgi:ribosome-associated protein
MIFIPIAPGIAFDPREIEESFVRSSGPGGQNVNKVSTAVQVRLDLRRPGSLPDVLRARAEVLGGRRVTQDGVLVITAQQHRSQDRNRQDAQDRIVALLREAAVVPVFRRDTKPTKAARRKRVEAKVQRGAVKRLRAAPVREG